MKTNWKNTQRLLSILLRICMVLALMPAVPLVAEAADVSYVATYSGSNGWVALTQSGNYLLNGATFDASSKPGYSGLDIGSGSAGINAVLYISGMVMVIAGDQTTAGASGVAGIYVPSGSTLTVRRAPGASSANLVVYGGDGGKAENGTSGINAGSGGGYSASSCGTIHLDNDVSYSITAGNGGAAGVS